MAALKGLLMEPAGASMTRTLDDGGDFINQDAEIADITDMPMGIGKGREYPGNPTVLQNPMSFNTTALSDGQTYVYSEYVRMNDGSEPQFGSSSGSENDFYGRIFSNKTPDSYHRDLIDEVNGIWRVWMKGTASGDQVRSGLWQNTTQAGQFKASWGQFENANYPTSSMPTTNNNGTTRGVCSCWKNTADFEGFDGGATTDFCLQFKFQMTHQQAERETSGHSRLFSLTDGGLLYLIDIYCTPTHTYVRFDDNVNVVSKFVATAHGFGDVVDVRVRVDSTNGLDAWVDGVKIGTSDPLITTFAASPLTIARLGTNGNDSTQGSVCVKKLRMINQSLGDAAIEGWT